jgi:hypothetical protein
LQQLIKVDEMEKIATGFFQTQMAKAKKKVKSDNTLEQSHYVSAPLTSTTSIV